MLVTTALGSIGVTDRGTGDRTPLLFLHGVGSDRSVWQPQIDHFAGERRTVAIDYPGYGDSDASDATGYDGFAVAVLATLAELGIKQAHVCGLSLGGVVAIAIHAAAPDRCASLILADSFARHPEGQAIHDRSLAALEEVGIAGLATARVDALVGASASREVRDEVVATMSRIDPAAYAKGVAAVWLADQRQRAAAISCPTLIMCGAEDRITPPALSEELKDLIPHAALVEISAAGHLANIEQPAIFNRVVEAFLAGIED